VEGRAFRDVLVAEGVRETAIRVEDQSSNTRQNIELALPFLREALESGLQLMAVSKWYHRRAIHVLRTLLPKVEGFYGLSWEPIYSDTPIARSNWMTHPEGKQKVTREWREVYDRLADDSFQRAGRIDGMWR
jgi:uncharacterized SAM-binding protein YcdF (DUF218 family)